MSYSFTVTASRGKLRTKLDEAVAVVERSETDAEEERHRQLVAVLNSVDELVDAVHRSGDDVVVAVSGHANSGHAYQQGINVSVTSQPSKAHGINQTKET